MGQTGARGYLTSAGSCTSYSTKHYYLFVRRRRKSMLPIAYVQYPPPWPWAGKKRTPSNTTHHLSRREQQQAKGAKSEVSYNAPLKQIMIHRIIVNTYMRHHLPSLRQYEHNNNNYLRAMAIGESSTNTCARCAPKIETLIALAMMPNSFSGAIVLTRAKGSVGPLLLKWPGKFFRLNIRRQQQSWSYYLAQRYDR